jgi:hypothetical protein
MPAGGKQVSESLDGARVVGNMLEDVEAEDRIHRIGKLELGDILALNLDAGLCGKAVREPVREPRVRLDGDHAAAVFRCKCRKSPDSGAGVQGRPAEIRSRAVEQPSVVPFRPGHPPKRLVLSRRCERR